VPHPKDIHIETFTYDLPSEKIALYPLAERDATKLLVFSQGIIKEDKFKRIAEILPSDALLVFNTTKVVPARLLFLNANKQTIELFCLEPNEMGLELNSAMSSLGRVHWNCLVGNLKRWKGEDLEMKGKDVTLYARMCEKNEQHVQIEFYWEPATYQFSEVLEMMGNIPIPPYLKRSTEQLDQERYQTIYAREGGSVAAPTAGLHFTETVLSQLQEKGIPSLSLTLHVGAGTFKPVKSAQMAEHEMHAEWIDVELDMIRALLHNKNRQIIPVGTTSLRTLESLYWMGVKAAESPKSTLAELEIKQWEVYEFPEKIPEKEESLKALIAWMESNRLERLVCHTQILIAPPYQLKMASGIITNFHQPQSTLLLLISAIVGDKWRDIYTYALEHGFRFLSYGDSSLLLK
jgi:S-adenosylmethionine:tRNA ribosyltransferase-isomerase